MQRIFVLTAALGLASGLVGAFAYDQLGSDVGAAPPPPGPTQVREQNLDGSGFIRVHEQGTANVAGTVNVGNLPAVQDVNVVLPQGRLIGLTMTQESGSTYLSEFADVADCGMISIMARGGTVGQIGRVSPDGTTAVEANLAQSREGAGLTASNGTVNGATTSSLRSVPVAAPFVQVLVSAGVGAPPSAWIWCEP
jgi:hypothetical protein